MSATNFYGTALAQKREESKGLTKTNQGGFAYAIDAWTQFRRFLILGADSPTFYASSQQQFDLNSSSVKAVLDDNGIKAVDMIVDISDRGLAPKNDPALVALSMAASYTNDERPMYAENVRSYALSVLPKVARTGTHLFTFAEYVNQQRGWGRGLRKAFGNWYTERSPMSLVSQVTKYAQRGGWSHGDLLRLSHPTPKNDVQSAIFKYVVNGILPDETDDKALVYLSAVEEMKRTDDVKHVVNLIREFNLPREVVPTQFLTSTTVWEALLLSGKSGMPFTAMLRNLATMTKIGLLEQGSAATSFVINQLHNEEAIKQARVHPIDVLKAKLIYQRGKGDKSDATWNPVFSIMENLDDAFYLSFGNVQPTGKRILMALDVSGSMTFGEMKAPQGMLAQYYSQSFGMSGQGLGGVLGLSPRIAATVLAMVTVRTERDYEILGFGSRLFDIGISKNDSLNAAMNKTNGMPFSGTDCSLPFRYAQDANKKFDAFCVYTDNETGGKNPSTALRSYREKSGIHDAKLIVNAMTAGRFSIADPTDKNMLDIVGFDASAPIVQSAFIRGEI